MQTFYRYYQMTFNCPSEVFLKGFKGVVFSEQDITERKKLEYQYYRALYFDECTGLPNRRLFEEKLKTAIGVAKRKASFVAVSVLDIKGMRQILDLYGTEVGDKLLNSFAQKLLSLVRVSDVVGRLWSDEFAVAFVDIKDPYTLDRIVRRVIDGVKGQYSIGDVTLYVDAWAGIAVFPMDSTNAEELLRQAHLAMTYAKQSKEPIYFYSKEVEDFLKDKQKIYHELFEAIRSKQFVLYYQPLCQLSRKEWLQQRHWLDGIIRKRGL